MRFTRSVAGLLAALMAGCLLACGPSKQAACMQICGGCCDPFGLCVGGLAADACGAGGAVCQACGTGSTCSAGTCVALAADGGADAGRDAGSTDAGLADAGPDAGADAGSDAGACGNFGSLCAADSSCCSGACAAGQCGRIPDPGTFQDLDDNRRDVEPNDTRASAQRRDRHHMRRLRHPRADSAHARLGLSARGAVDRGQRRLLGLISHSPPGRAEEGMLREAPSVWVRVIAIAPPPPGKG